MPGPPVMARTPRTRRAALGQRVGTSTRGLSQPELREILGAMDRLVGQLPGLGRQRVITTEEAEHFRGMAGDW